MKRIKEGGLAILLLLFIVSGVMGADLSDPVDTSTLKPNKRYQYYSTLATYTSVTIPVKQDLGRSGGLGYVRNKGTQIIEVFPNYLDDTTNSLNGIQVEGSNTVWNFSPSNFAIDSLKIRSTTATTLNIEIVLH